MTSSDKRGALESIREENLRFYDTPQGRGFLRMLDLTFEERWIYLAELLQNALDADAVRIAVRIDGDRLVFQHDGMEPLTAESVRAMSQVFRSTKGAATVGFMGIGFKSVFRRFSQVGVSGFGWSYRYAVDVTTGDRFGDRQLDLLGCVTPLWDQTVPDPDAGYTTRFELSGCLDPVPGPAADIAAVVPEDDPTILALLAYRGVSALILGDHSWNLHISRHEKYPLARAESNGTVHRWRLFIQRYVPSDAAVARFLERRRIRPAPEERDAVYAAAQREREVIGLLPIDEDDRARPPDVGRVYATMPTSATWPFRMQLHADWLVNVSRTGLPELEDNAWQESIISHVPGVIADFVDWLTVTHHESDALRAGFSVLQVPRIDGPTTLDRHMAGPQWRANLAGALRSMAMLPTFEEHRISLRLPADVVLPPPPLAVLAADSGRYPEALFGGPAVVAEAMGVEAIGLLEWLELLTYLTAADLRERWNGGPHQWWEQLSEDPGAQRSALFELWAAFAALTRTNPEWAELPCVPTQSGGWIGVAAAKYIADPMPSPDEPWEAGLFDSLRPYLPSEAARPADAVLAGLRSTDAKDRTRPTRREAREFFEASAEEVTLSEVVAAAVEDALMRPEQPFGFLIALAQWARHRNRGDLVTHLVAARGDTRGALSPGEALLAEPYVEHATVRRRMWPNLPAVVPDYVDVDPYAGTGDAWRAFLEARGTIGPLRIVSVEQRVWRWEKEKVSAFGAIALRDVPDTSQHAGYRLTDRVLDPPLADYQFPHLAEWLDGEYTKLNGQGRRTLSGSYYSAYTRTLAKPASWVAQLQEISWVPTVDGALLRPEDVIPTPDPARDDAPFARLAPTLVEQLEREGVRFGTNVPEAPEIRRLQRMGNSLEAERLAALIGGALDAATGNEDERNRLLGALSSLTVPRSDGGERVRLNRVVRQIGSGFRSSLGGWVASLSECAAPLRSPLEDPRLPIVLPATTTGAQALEFLESVWKRAREGEAGLADAVRRLLPVAYSYVLDDVLEDESLASRWREARNSAIVFGTSAAGRRWAPVAESPIPLFDDLRDPLLRPFLDDAEVVATPGHLGDSLETQERVASALGVRSVSALLQPQWQYGTDRQEPGWEQRFTVVQALLRGASDSEQAADPLVLRPLTSIRVTVRGEFHELSARLQGMELLAAGEPADFADEAAAALLEYYGLENDTKQITFATVLVAAIGDARRFSSAVSKFARTFVRHIDVASLLGSDRVDTDREAEEDTLSDDDEAPGPIFVSESPATLSPGGSDILDTERRRGELLNRVDTILMTLNGDEIAPPSDGPSGQPRPTPPTRQITPEQQQRGEAGEVEFMRRVSGDSCWGGMTLLADRRRDGCGYDFLCTTAEGTVKVEVKTFTTAGRVVITPREWREARSSRGAYWLVGFLDDGGSPQHWSAYVISDPFPLLEAQGEWQLIASLDLAAHHLFSIRE